MSFEIRASGTMGAMHCIYDHERLLAIGNTREDAERIVDALTRQDGAADEARAESERLRAALAWYADEDRYDKEELYVEPAGGTRRRPLTYWASLVDEDRGEHARAALAAEPRAGGNDDRS